MWKHPGADQITGIGHSSCSNWGGLDALEFDHHGFVNAGIVLGIREPEQWSFEKIYQFYSTGNHREALEKLMGPGPEKNGTLACPNCYRRPIDVKMFVELVAKHEKRGFIQIPSHTSSFIKARVSILSVPGNRRWA